MDIESADKRPLKELIQAGYADPAFRLAVSDALNWVPELKHEGLVCTHLSSSLRKQGVASRREVTKLSRRYDLEIAGVPVEAKYHFEGDIGFIYKSVEAESRYVYDRRGWNSAQKSIHDELNRQGSSYFLWFVCVRNGQSLAQYKFPGLIRNFRLAAGSNELDSMVAVAIETIDGPLLDAFRIRRSIEMFELPTITAAASALISRLYFMPEHQFDAAHPA